MENNIHPIFDRLLQRSDRELQLGQRSKVLWLTGLSGSGKSTIAQHLERKLYNDGFFVQVLDGDNIRSGINNNLGFSAEDRVENIRRIAEIAKLYLNTGVITINSFISPTNEIRQMAKDIIGSSDFIEVYVNASVETCEKRDVKGLYKKARTGELKNFTGIEGGYEAPSNPAIEIKTENLTIEESVDIIYNHLVKLIKLDS